MLLKTKWLLCLISALLATAHHANSATAPSGQGVVLESQSRQVAHAAKVGLLVAQGVRIPGVPETNDLPLPRGYQQPRDQGQEMPAPIVPPPTPRRAPAVPSFSGMTRAENSFRATKPEPLEKVTNLECVVERETSVDSRDPIYKMVVRLILDDDSNVQDLTVIHHARSGAKYNRADQYVGAQLSQAPGRTDYTWTGTLSTNSAKMMKAALSEPQI